ncbi:MAG TPA: histidine-type phosphatase [Caulobacteraceae bacterium]|jgi:4-phytase/acid phosphatase
MHRTLVVVLAALVALVGGVADAAPTLERVVVVMRHGVRPPTQPAAVLGKYSAEPWPAWPVQPGDLTPHGAQTVALTGRTIRAAYVAHGLLPAHACAGPGAVSVWADGADERTQMTGIVLAASLEAGCPVPVDWKPGRTPRDPIFGGAMEDACKVDPAHMWTPVMTPAAAETLKAANARLQEIFAPTACQGGPGVCFARSPESGGVFPMSAGLSEDILLEYAEGMPMKDVGWGRASPADIGVIMAIHETTFGRFHDNTYASARRGAAMARLILAALDGQPAAGGPQTGPGLRLLGLAGHDTNLTLMAGTFGLTWKLPDQPDSTAPSTALAFELWRDGPRRYVRPVLYYQTLDQLRTLQPALARALPLRFADCAGGPMGSCPLEAVRRHVEALIPPDCGVRSVGPSGEMR